MDLISVFMESRVVSLDVLLWGQAQRSPWLLSNELYT